MKTLFKNRWVEVRELAHRMPDGSILPYTSVKDGIGESIAVMPWRSLGPGKIEVLLRNEITPPWLVGSTDPNERRLSSLTGMMEEGEDARTCAARELYEESGYVVENEDMQSLGFVRLAKCLETRVHLWAVDVTGLAPEVAPGDGGGFEEHAQSIWCTDLSGTQDVVAFALLAKLLATLK